MTSKSKLIKVVLLGDGGVGKSSLMNRFVSNKFDTQSFHTIGVEFLNKELSLGNDSYRLQIWDTAGQERFKSLRTPFYRGADCCLLTFAVDDKRSFENISMWHKEFAYYADIADDNIGSFPFVIIGNKVDVTNRQVMTLEAAEWCDQNGHVPYFETSAKDATNVEAAFVAAVKRLKEFEEASITQDIKDSTQGNTVDLSKKRDQVSNSGCCN